MSAVEIAIGVSHRPWAQDLFRHVADHGGAVVRKRVLTDEDALEEDYTVLVVDDIANALTPRVVHELHRRNRRILAVHSQGDPHAEEALARLGVDAAIEDTTSPEEFVAAIAKLASTVPPDSVDDAFLDIARELGEDLSRPGPAVPAGLEPRRAWVTAVAAPSGGCGATEVAIALAAALRHRGESAVVVDADEVAPALAQRVGAPLVPNVRNAIDAVEQQVGSLAETLTPVREGRFEVLCGLSSAADWTDLRPDELTDVITELAGLRQQVVVNVGHRTEDVTAPSGLSRYGVTRAMLQAADQVVLVSLATPMGVARLLDWLGGVQDLIGGKPVHVALNRAPTSRYKQGELEQELFRSYMPASFHLLPGDRRVEDAAWNGQLVSGGPFAKAVAGLANALPAAARPGWGRRAERRGGRKPRARGGRR